MSIAVAEQGIRRFGPGEGNPRIVEYNGHTDLVGYDDKISWCSSFTVLWKRRYTRQGIGPGVILAGVGKALDRPVYRCVAH